MSKTIRCKNYEIESEQNSWRRWGKKTGLQYTTETDYGYYETGKILTWHDGSGSYPERKRYLDEPIPMEGRERYRKWRIMHGESSSRNARTPGKWYRKHRMSENRSINKGQFNRWLQSGGEYDPVFEADPRSHYWDWS